MRRITILTTGSRGDVQPYLALGKGLKDQGLNIRIATFEMYKEMVTNLGLEYFPVRGDLNRVMNGEDGLKAMQTDNPLKVALSFRKLQSLVFDIQEDFYQACFDTDALVYHPGAAIGYFLGKKFHIPSILATPFPMTPTHLYPSLIFYNKLPKNAWLNWFSHKIFEKIMWSASAGPIKNFWKKTFGELPKDFGNPFPKQNTEMNPTIIGTSPFVFPVSPDWGENIYQNGYWFLDSEPDWKPDDELLKFLDQGEPPVYIGFGSVGDPSKAEKTTQTILDALKSSGQRGIIATGWHGLTDIKNTPDNVFILQSAPHTWLFPKMKAVIHHGGAGTTAAGFRAGVPSVIIPHGNDQFAWGQRAFELGVGAKPIPRKQLTSQNLAQAIHFALRPSIQQSARKMGQEISQEKGIEQAVKVILNTLG